MCRGILFLGIAVLPVRAEWIKLTTPHFEMYTTNTRTSALRALDTLEQARCFFDESSRSKTVTEAPVRIIAFQSEAEFRPYSPNPGAVAFYQRGRGLDYIVMRDLEPGSSSVAVHEYTHLYFGHHNLHLPLWLNEGLADVYSTLQRRGAQLIIGLPPPGRLEAMKTLPPLNLHRLIAVDQESPYYRDSAKMEEFYSESWALAHMLFLGPEYRSDFQKFFGVLNEGDGTEESFQRVYGKTLTDVAVDLRTYISQNELPITSSNVHLNRTEVPELSELTPQEIELVLADLLSTGRETTTEAHARLRALATESPSDPDVQKSLGYVAWRQGNIDEAKEHFRQAVQDGSTDALMIFQYAGLLHATGAPPAQVINMLKLAVELKPDFYDARFNLGMEAASQGQCQVALSALAAIKTISSDRAYRIYSVLAYCTWKEGSPANARHWAELAREYAASPEETANAEQLLRQLRSR
jgi:Tfp pilus assembly protein PilF